MSTSTRLFAALALVVGLGFGYLGGEQMHRGPPGPLGSEARVHSYLNGQLTNPLLECVEASEPISIGDRVEIEKDVQTYVTRALREGIITETAIYFRDLNHGPWFGINERSPFTPGSLLKLPLAMSYYWSAQRTPDVLDAQVEFVGVQAQGAVEGNFGSDAPLAPGVYSIRDLIGFMLRESSNDAAEVLVSAAAAADTSIERTYNDLGIKPPDMGKDYEIDVKTFGAFLRVLYNASYVGQRGSEELLAALTQASFRDGLVAGVPSSVKVAHKFGTRVVEGAGGRQLHDCGIVYAPRTPYILCVMSRGNSSKNLSYFIANVSHIVYEGVVQNI